MEETDQNLSYWLSIASVFLSEKSTSQMKLISEQKIYSQIESSEYSFINQVLSWLKENPDNIELWELTLWTLTPSYSSQIENYNKYYDSEEHSEDLNFIIDLITKNIKSDNEVLRQYAAKIFTIFFRLDEKYIEKETPKLNFILKDKNQPREYQKSVVFLFSYLITSNNFIFPFKPSPLLADSIGLIFELLITHLEDMSDFEIDFKISILNIACSICDTSGLLFLMDKNWMELVKNIGIILDIYNEVLTKEAMKTLTKIFHVYYWNLSDQECDDIIMMTKKYMDINNKKLTDSIKKSVLYFWEDIAKYESEIIDSTWSQIYSSNVASKQKTEESKPIKECQNRSGQAAIELLDCIIDMISNLDPNATEVEDPSKKEVSMVAIVALKYMYKAVPTSIYEALKIKFEEFLVSDKWWLKHTAALIVYIFSSRLNEKISSRPFIINVTKYLHEKFFDILSLINTTNQRLRETAMWSLSQLLLVYPYVISDFPDPGLVVNKIMDMFTACNPIDETTHPSILLRTSAILFNTIKAFKMVPSSNPLSKDKELFGRIYNFLIGISKLPQCNQNSKIFHNAYETIIILFQRTPKMAQLFPNIMKNSVETLKELESLPEEQKINNEVFSQKESSICALISSLLLKNHDNLSEYFNDITSLLFTIISRDDKIVLEDALQTLNNIISLSTPLQLPIPNPDILFGSLTRILKNFSGNGGILKNCTTLISEIFSLNKNIIIEWSYSLLDALYDTINQENISNKLLPCLLTAYSDIIMNTFAEKKENTNKYKDQFLELLKKYRDMKFDTSNSDQIKTLNEILETCCKSFNCYGKIFFKGSDKKHEREILNEVTKLSQVIYDNKEHLTHATIKTSLGVLKTYSLNASPQNKISFSKGINSQLISLGLGHKDLNDYASFVNSSIKFRGKGSIAVKKSGLYAAATKARAAAFASLPE